MATLPFHLLDVFTTGAAMTGNQLLVVEDWDDTLTDDSDEVRVVERRPAHRAGSTFDPIQRGRLARPKPTPTDPSAL